MKIEVGELTQIPFLNGCSEVRPLLEGYSEEGKFQIVKGGRSYLIRTFDVKNLTAKKAEFAMLAKLEAMGVRCSQPVEFGSSGRFGYMILTFLAGINGEHAMRSMSDDQQYQAGLEAGAELKKMNSATAPFDVSPWEVRRLEKSRRYLANYRSGSDRFNDDDKVIDFVEANLKLLTGRPNTFQHDDFHLRNLIYNDGKFTGVIDFNRYDWGDPIHEFVKVGQFGAELSVPFCVGQLRGYHGGQNPSEEFWSFYALYMAMTAFSSIVWTKHVCPEEMPEAIDRIEKFVADHRAFESSRPQWFKEFA